jgi:hypothetical protein
MSWLFLVDPYLVHELELYFAEDWIEDYDPHDESPQRPPCAGCGCAYARSEPSFPLISGIFQKPRLSAQTPDDLLIHQYHLDADVVLQKLREQVERRGGIKRVQEIDKLIVAQFVGLVREHIDSQFSQ